MISEIPFYKASQLSIKPGERLDISRGYYGEGSSVVSEGDNRVKEIIEGTLTELSDETTEKVGSYAFYKYTDLQEVTLPNVTTIGEYVFSGCVKLETVNFGDKLVELGNNAFYQDTLLSNVVLPEGLNSIGGSCFHNCWSLTNISLPDSITTIGGYAFVGATQISVPKLPANLITVGEVAFYNLQKATFTHIPAGV